MSSRSLNKVMLIGNVSLGPDLRYTPQGTAVCTFSVATNRSWTDQSGQVQEVAEFTRCVAWAKLAEVCSQILSKGRKVFVEGRLQTREWEGQDKIKRRSTEVVIESMIALGPPTAKPSSGEDSDAAKKPAGKQSATKKHVVEANDDLVSPKEGDELVPAEDIPF